jgi:hypothetical protein
MKVMVFPARDLERVEPVVRRALTARAGADALSLTILRVSYPRGWSVQATGLGDPILERGLSDVVEDALKRSGV